MNRNGASNLSPPDEPDANARELLDRALITGKMMLYSCEVATGFTVRSNNSVRLLGVASEGPTEDWSRIILNEDLPYFENAVKSITAQDPVFEVEYRVRHPVTGIALWILDRGEGEFDADGQRIRVRGAIVEISGRVRAETQMRETTRLHSVAFEAARMGAWHLDVRSNRLTSSDELLALLGLSREQFDETPEAFDSVVHPDDLGAWTKSRDISIGPDKNVEIEFRVILPKSGIRWFLSRAEIIRRSDGIVLECYGVMIDISERKIAEEAAARLAAIVTSSDDAIISSNLSNIITSWNHGAERLLGYRAEEITGQPVYRIIPEELWDGEQKNLDLVSNGEPIAAYESRRRHQNGRILDMSLSISPIRNNAGKVVGASTIALDITARLRDAEIHRESDARLRQALAAAKAGAFDYDLVNQEIRWSPEMFALYGLDPEKAVPSFDAIMAQTVPEHEQRVRSEFALALSQGGQFALEFPIIRPDGAEIWTAMTGYIKKDALGRATNARGIDQDISERKDWERRQALLLRELSHRVKNSMAVIQSVTRQTLRTTNDPKSFAEAFEGRIRSLAASHTLLTDVDWRGVRLTDLIKLQTSGMADDFERRFSLRGPEVLLPAETATQLGLVLHELGTNAAKYGALSLPGGKVSITWKKGHGKLRLTWRERGGPSILEYPTRQGFGTALINSSVVDVKRRFDPAGLTCRLALVL
ncbi:MAG TPA: PAS domain-containing protein [Aestuariivirga sp.]|nr:PAS domain-containing protein [Aestuariivirga sp.]